ncbi:nuclear migration protein nudF [Penicillium longicatenatum]|uniref:nuclear migration protein nudF n=1 Tax=Penicillium longicatenatum TaxID=1561947 RepID=UPI0025475A71|nr:nuclear migration protein nudF [Penicillium longicatenatum]KAJ5630823.1 nuclear migration protein nudF [Penicillium longicatenatum]
MGSILTDSQSKELHKAIIGYLSTLKAFKTVTTFREELELNTVLTDHAIKQLAQILEKKWTTNTLLQRKIMRLETEVDRLTEELRLLPKPHSRHQDPANWLPDQPAHALKSHRAAITSVAFHPTFNLLASSSEDCSIKIWDWELGEHEKTIKGHTRTVTGLDFGGMKGQILLASCSTDLTIKIWDPNTNYSNVRTLVGHEHSISCVRFLRPGDKILVSASRDASIRLWDASNGFCLKTIYTSCDWIRDVSISFDGKWLVSGGSDHAATIWNVASGDPQAILRGHGNDIECCAFAPLASHSYLVALAGGKALPSGGSAVGVVATAGRDKTIKLWDFNGLLLKTLVGHENWVRGLVFHPGGRFLLSVGDDRTLRCWDLADDGRLRRTVEEVHGGFVSCVRWAPSVMNDAGSISSTEAMEDSRKKREKVRDATLRCVLATGSSDSKVRIFM